MDERLSQKEQYELKRKKKLEQRDKSSPSSSRAKRLSRRVIWTIVILAVLGAGGWYLVSSFSISEEDVVSRNGIHWHPRLAITIEGEQQVIPANVGIAAGRAQSYHTHRQDNILHVEPQGIVIDEDIKLKKFFDVWGETFNSQCIFEFCNGPEGSVRMFVNGEPNFDFENYLVRDGDRIEISFE